MNPLEFYLKQLAAMVKRKARPQFKDELRQKLMHQARELNEKPASRWKEAWKNFRNSIFQGHRWVSVTAAMLILVIGTLAINPGGFKNNPVQLVNLAEAQDFYTLTPSLSDTNGISEETTFKLASKENLDVEEVKQNLSISPEIAFEIDKTAGNTLEIKPLGTLEPGTVYQFKLEGQNLKNNPFPKEFSWSYEVSEEFKITGTLPKNHENYIYINTGIEISFNRNGVEIENFKNHFSITPAVEGTFDVKGKTGIFIPKTEDGLKPSTIYKVAIKSGLGIKNSEKILQENFNFEFKTQEEGNVEGEEISFDKEIYDFNPNLNPNLGVNYYRIDTYNDEQNVEVSINLYRYPTGEAYLEALRGYREISPQWAYYTNRIYGDIPTDGLEKVLEIPKINAALNPANYGRWMSLPQSLNEGYYLIEMQKGNLKDQSFVQVSPLASYIAFSKEKSIIWVNNTATKGPVENATVEILDHDLEAKTNNEGVASFEELNSKIKLPEEDQTALYLKITSGEKNVYYETVLNPTTPNETNDTWQVLQTEREVYRPDDTVFYWGFLQGREKPLQKNAKMVITPSYLTYAKEIAGEQEKNTILHEENIVLKDGEAFEGKVNLKKFNPGYYMMYIIQDDNIVSRTGFSVSNYIKPAYQIVVDPEKTVLLEGESTPVKITARFFEGTPVAHTNLRYEMWGETPQVLTTDEKGEIITTMTAKVDCPDINYCSWENYQGIYVTPVQEELADIQGQTTVRIIRSKAHANPIELSHKALSMTVHTVDLEKINHNSSNWKESSDVEAGPSANTPIEVSITRVDWIQIETGEYYDNIDKQIHKTYQSVQEEIPMPAIQGKTDAEGKFNYNLTLDPAHDYRMVIKITDAEGAFYTENSWLSKKTPDGNTEFLMLETNKGGTTEREVFKQGEEVQISMIGVSETTSNHYLFLQTQDGILNEKISTEPRYEFKLKKEHIPNLWISGVQFDGTYYQSAGEKNIEYDAEEERLDIEMHSDKKEYEPGEKVTLDFKVQEKKSGKGVPAQVNLSLVDEAYYELYPESFRDPLGFLYNDVSGNVEFKYASQVNPMNTQETGGMGGCFIAGTLIKMADGSTKKIENIQKGDIILTRKDEWSNKKIDAEVTQTFEKKVGEYLWINENLGITEEHILFVNGQWQLAGEIKIGDTLINESGKSVTITSIEQKRKSIMVYNFTVADHHTYFANGIYVHNDKGGTREDFRDTAVFSVVSTDANGWGTFTFTLPDNITSWQVSAGAVRGGEKVQGGYSNIPLKVSRALFVVPNVNTQYLVGDEPNIPVRAYGSALEESAAINFTIKSETLNLNISTEGKAFETSYAALPPLSEGQHSLEVRGKDESGNSDGVKLNFEVKESNLEQTVAKEEKIQEGTNLDGSLTHRTDVTFVNKEMASVYNFLQVAAARQGERVDEAVARAVGTKNLNTYFKGKYTLREFSNLRYQYAPMTGEGLGVALLPYSDTDLRLSVLVAAVDADLWDTAGLKQYFQFILENEETSVSEKIMSITGLAALGKKPLNELNYLVENFDLSLEDKIYAAWGYSLLEDSSKSTKLFIQLLEESKETIDNTLYLTASQATLEETLSWTTLMAGLAQRLGSDQRDALWNYVIEHEEELEETHLGRIDLEKLLVVKYRLSSNASDIESSFSLNGEKIILKNNDVYTLSVTPEELGRLNFKNIKGEIFAITTYREKTQIDSIQNSATLKLSKVYRVNGEERSTFKPGDIIQVYFKVEVPVEVEGSYRITDYLPSGLQSASNTYVPLQWELVQNTSMHLHPYEDQGQELSFYISCNPDYPCEPKEFYYLARVINTGKFIDEPAIIQGIEDPDQIRAEGERQWITIE